MLIELGPGEAGVDNTYHPHISVVPFQGSVPSLTLGFHFLLLIAVHARVLFLRPKPEPAAYASGGVVVRVGAWASTWGKVRGVRFLVEYRDRAGGGVRDRVRVKVAVDLRL